MPSLITIAAIAGVAGAIAVSAPPSRARAEGSTLTSVKAGACALLTADDARRIWNIPMQVAPGSPGQDFPGRHCAYRPARPDAAYRIVQFRLLDAREWAQLKSGGLGQLESAGMKGIGDEAYFVRVKGSPRARALLLFARRGTSQFSVRVAGRGVELTEPVKQVARRVAARL